MYTTGNRNLVIVTSHYGEDLNWLVDQKYFDYKIYTKNLNNCRSYPNDKIFECINKGFESSSYLSYIIQNYHSLPEYVAFIHGHENSEHQTDSTLNLILNSPEKEYFSINRKDWRNTLSDNSTSEADKRAWKWIKDNFNSIVSHLPLPNKLEFTACAQFIVSKQSILSNSIESYKHMMDWLESTELPDQITGRIFEYLWCYIFTHNEIEQ